MSSLKELLLTGHWCLRRPGCRLMVLVDCRQLKYLGNSIGDEHGRVVCQWSGAIVVQWCCLSTLTFARQLG